MIFGTFQLTTRPEGVTPHIECADVDSLFDNFVCYGPPEQVVEEVTQLGETGVDELICSFRWGDLTSVESDATMEQFAGLVIPETAV